MYPLQPRSCCNGRAQSWESETRGSIPSEVWYWRVIVRARDCRTYSVLSAGTTRASTRRNRASSVAAARRSVVVERRSVVVAVGLLLSAHGPILSALVMRTADLNLRCCCCRADAENARTCCGARAQFSSTGRSKHRVHDDLAAQPFLRSTILPPSSARAARIACVAPPVFWLAAPDSRHVPCRPMQGTCSCRSMM